MSQPTLETIFEKRRGISRIEVRHGYAQVHVSQFESRIMDQRLRILEAVAHVGISIDFLKLTPSGLSFMVPEESAEAVAAALGATTSHHSIRMGRSIVLVYAVNIRDEEGMIAETLRRAIASCARVDHVGDMHDRLLMVVKTEDVEKVLDQFSQDERSIEVSA